MPSLGLSLGLGRVRVLGAAGPIYDPDATAWFEAVEATGATFGPDSATVSANKTAWSNWVIAQKNAESPIAGRSNWDQLTHPGEGYIQPLMGVSTFNIPAMFGERTFTGFVSGDHLPAMGLKGGDDKVLLANRDWAGTPQNDVAAGMWITESGGASTRRILGQTGSDNVIMFLEDARTRNRASTLSDLGTTGPNYNGGVFPRAAFISRSSSANYSVRNDATYSLSVASAGIVSATVSFFALQTNTANASVRSGLAFYGRSIDVEAMNIACVALSQAITW